jgi:hypothetical protein
MSASNKFTLYSYRQIHTAQGENRTIPYPRL